METIQPIGTIHSPHQHIEKMPIQPKGASGIEGYLLIHERYREGLKDLKGFSHIYLIYQFHKAVREALIVTPFMDTQKRGVFATRSPLRPNHIGISIVRLQNVVENKVYVEDLDILDGTPLLDIKPYIETFDVVKDSRSGWMSATDEDVRLKRSDDRFK